MDNFIGKWEGFSKSKELDQLIETIEDLNEIEKEKYKKCKSSYEIIKYGGKYSVKMTTTACPDVQKTFHFSLDKPFEGQAFDDGNVEATISFENNELVENGKHEIWGDNKITRRVNNKKMDVIMEIAGKEISYTMERV